MNKLMYYIILSSFLIQPAQAMKKSLTLLNIQKQAPRLSFTQFKELADYSATFLTENEGKLKGKKNELGFIQFEIPTPQDHTLKESIAMIGLDLWREESNITSLENIHTHSNYFESIVIKGGYTHALYKFCSKKNGTPYNLYREYKKEDINGRETTYFGYKGKSYLKFIKNETLVKKDIIACDTDYLHQVISVLPKTLILNIVFKQEKHENEKGGRILIPEIDIESAVKYIEDSH